MNTIIFSSDSYIKSVTGDAMLPLQLAKFQLLFTFDAPHCQK